MPWNRHPHPFRLAGAAALCCVVLFPLGLGLGCTKEVPTGGKKRRGPVAFPVEVQAVESRSVAYTVTAVGSLEAFEEVQVTARVAGAVERVRFQEGQEVKQGQLLAEIEPGRYRLAVASAQAGMQRAAAVLADAQSTAQRRQRAAAGHPGVYTAEEMQGVQARVDVAAADVAAAGAALNLAQLNLRDALVRAPVAGIMQSRTVQTGQYVQPGSVLGTLLQREPMHVRFDVPEADASRLTLGQPLSFTIRGVPGHISATLNHIAGAANPMTRMVSITADLDKPSADLRPGSFAQVSIPVGAPIAAPVIPQTAVRPSEKGFLAYVVVDGNTARERVLALGMRTTDGWVEVRNGLSNGELLVVRGAEALREGAEVKVVATAPPGASPAEIPRVAGGVTAADGGAGNAASGHAP